MHATFYEEIPSSDMIAALSVSQAQYKKLAEHISQTFVLKEGKALLVPTDAVYGRVFIVLLRFANPCKAHTLPYNGIFA